MPLVMGQSFSVYAIKYAWRPAVPRADYFYEADCDGGGPLLMDYFTWVAVSGSTICAIDTGFKRDTGEARGREYVAPPRETLARLGIDTRMVPHLVLTHLHWDHSGNVDDFPAAEIVLQEAEMAFWSGRWAGRGQFRHLHTPGDLAELIHANADGRIRWVDGDAEVVPGITVHRVGGHSPGMQVVRVLTEAGAVVIGSDASHFFANIESDRPFRILHDVPGMYASFDRINELASAPELVVAGHDPLIFERFPAASPELEGIAVKIA
jgi:glyoxylase-like metal-dependent hydrolase (beta-lactamase superfamily II)